MPQHYGRFPPQDEVESRFGAGARNSRFTWSRGQSAAWSLIVVLTDFPRTAPRRPIWRIRRATMHRATSIPSRPSWRQTLRTP